jgi:threonine/homoserine/homoserine lactone efflux protein
MILSLIYQGLIIVLLLTFSFGPAFFSLINTAIKYGYKPASLLAIGVVASDFFLCILVCLLVYFGAVNLLHSEKAQTFSAIIGGVILIVFGAFYFKKHVTKSEKSIDLGYIAPHPLLMVLKGFLINLFNPAVWFLWLGNVTAISKTLEYSLVNMILFFSVVLAAVLFVELAKISLAEKIKIYLTDKLMTIINYITGTVLMLFGFVLIYNHFFGK